MAKRRILVVDDDPAIRTMEERMLSAAGYEVQTAEGGQAALSKVAAERFDLFLLDVMMPGMTGFELARALKQGKATKDTPIVFATAKDGQDGVSEGFAAGATLYLVKPFTTRTLLSTVRAAVGEP